LFIGDVVIIITNFFKLHIFQSSKNQIVTFFSYRIIW